MKDLIYGPFDITTHNPETSDYLESVFYHGNGYMGSRGYACEDSSARPHQKGIYIAGVFDSLKDNITDMVNTPDFLRLSPLFDHADQNPEPLKLSGFKQSLQLSDGVFTREYLMHDKGQSLSVKISRFFSLRDTHVAAIRLEVTPVNFSGMISCLSSIDMTSCNLPINDDQVKKNTQFAHYIQVLSQNPTDTGGLIEMQTKGTEITLVEAFGIQYSTNINPTDVSINNDSTGISRTATFHAQKGITYHFDKFICVFTSRDTKAANLRSQVLKKLDECCEKGYNRLLEENTQEWKKRWATADIKISGDLKDQCAIRYNIFQLVGNHSESDDHVSIGARGLTHPRYKGCYFWDTEIFMLPYFIYSNPVAAKNLLKYRYNSLAAARDHAKKMNDPGARYPWMTSFDGSEQCESWDTGACEIHITCDVAFAFDHYVKATGDMDFLTGYASEVFIETARFWASRYTYDSQSGRYNLLFTKGPDEYCGVSHNNTYTLFLSLYNLRLAIEAIEYMKINCPQSLETLYQKIDFNENEIDKWEDIAKKTPLNYDQKLKLYIQDDTFMKLEPLDIARHKKDNTPLYHQICFDRLQRYRVLKQADIVLLMALFPNDFTPEQKKAAWDFYEPLTLHDSTLSFGTHALLGSQINETLKAWDYLKKSLYLDLENTMNNTGTEGLHLAALGATWQAVVFGFAGLSFKDGIPCVNPHLPEGWEEISFTLVYQGRRIHITAHHSEGSYAWLD